MLRNNTQGGAGTLNGVAWTQRDAQNNETDWVTPISDSGTLATATHVDLVDQSTIPASSGGGILSYRPAISDDGRFVSFLSNATNLGDTTGGPSVYLRDRKTESDGPDRRQSTRRRPRHAEVAPFLDNSQCVGAGELRERPQDTMQGKQPDLIPTRVHAI